MQIDLQSPEFEQISSFIQEKTGLHYPFERKRDLEKGLLAAAKELRVGNPDEIITALKENHLTPAFRQVLVKHLTIGETYFFREPGVLYFLLELLKPEIEQRRRGTKSLRLWSAGCCSGEEAYSMAILLSKQIPDIADWNISILGSDINTDFITRARHGVYRDWSFRGIQDNITGTCFTKISEDEFKVKPEIQKLVRFEYINLFENTYPSPINSTNTLDAILCRNVLMYFNEEGRRQILEKFANCLTANGYLAVSLTELSYIPSDLFEPVIKDNLFIYRKRRQGIAHILNAADKKKQAELFAARDNTRTATAPLQSIQFKAEPKTATVKSFKEVLANAIFAYDNTLFEKSELLFRELLNDKRLWNTGSSEEKENCCFYLSRQYADGGNLPGAKKLLETVLEELKLSVKLYLVYANVLAELNLNDAALATLKKCIFLDDANIAAHYFIAQSFKRLQKPKEARRYLEITARLLDKADENSALEGLRDTSVRELKNIVNTALENG